MLVCTRCGTQNEPRARYCSACGISLYPTLPPTERQPMARSGQMPPLREIHRADPLLGLIIAERYRVLELIGRGGMGVVYKAEHSRLGKILALKLLTGELTRHSEQVVRFKREALMASRLSHPNTVQVFDFGDADGLAYGVGGEFHLTSKDSIRGDWTRHDYDEGEADAYNISYVRRF